MIMIVFLQLFVWVSQPINLTQMEVFDNGLVKRTTPIIVEEFVQEETSLIITKDSTKADIWITPVFVFYERPNTESSIFIFKGLKEEVGLEMRYVFKHKNYDIFQYLVCKETLVKEAKSNFFSIEDDTGDFADMLIFNLIKKTTSSCFGIAKNLLF